MTKKHSTTSERSNILASVSNKAFYTYINKMIIVNTQKANGHTCYQVSIFSKPFIGLSLTLSLAILLIAV